MHLSSSYVGTDGTYHNVHIQTSAEWDSMPILTLVAMTQTCNLFFCLPRSQREDSDMSFLLFYLFFPPSCFFYFHFSIPLLHSVSAI